MIALLGDVLSALHRNTFQVDLRITELSMFDLHKSIYE